MRVAVVGAGYFAQFHLEAWQRMPGVDLVGLADRNPDARAPWDVPGFDDLDTMLATVKPDVLDIALPPTAHMAAIETATAAGIPAVICQKPFCQGLEGAERAVAHAERTGLRLIVHENFRFQPWHRAIRAVLDAGRLGDVQQLTFRMRTGDGQGPEAYLARQPYFQTMPRFLIHETGVHFLDVFLYLLGPVSSVYADLHRLNPAITGEDAGQVLLTHASGVRSLFDGNRHLDHDAATTRLTFGEALVEGTQGTLTLTGDGAVSLRPFGTQTHETILAAQEWPGFAGDCVYGFQASAIKALTSETPAETEASAYLEVLRLQELVYQSAEQGRRLPA